MIIKADFYPGFQQIALLAVRGLPVPERRDIGRALQPDEKLRLLRVAQYKPEWETADLATVVALNTTMRGREIKELRWRDTDLMDRSLVVRPSKTRGWRASDNRLTARKIASSR